MYERDYILNWDDLLNDLEIVRFSTLQQDADALGIIVGAGSPSPLRVLLKTVVDNTSIVATPTEAKADASPSFVDSAKAAARDALDKAQRKLTGNAVTPGTAITEHFDPIHRVMAGAPAPIDGMFGQV